ncbi:MAG: hypothetical protein ABR584_05135 [Candidatus Baltobacteraceae bacterium]
MKFNRNILTVVIALAVTGTAFATPNTLHRMHNAMSGKVQNINMGALHGSRQNGTAVVKGAPGGVWVKIALFNEPKGASEPAHIHMGTCQKGNPSPWKPLSNVVNGTSITTVKGVTVDQLKDGHYFLNVHKSAGDLKTYVSCGNLK